MEVDIVQAMRRIPGRKVAAISVFQKGGDFSLKMTGNRSLSSATKLKNFTRGVKRALSVGGSLMICSYLRDGRAVCYWVRLGNGGWQNFNPKPHMTRLGDSPNQYNGDIGVYL